VDEEVGFEVWIGRVLFEPIPDLRPLGVPDRLCAVVETAMAKRVADRYGSAAELGEALQAVQREHGLQPTSMLVVPVTDTELRPLPDPPSPPPWRVALCSLLVVAFVVGVVLVVFRRATCTPLARPADSILSFGTLFPKTGTFSFGGPAMQAGARLAIDDVEAAGGVFPGITVRLDEANQLDDGGGTERSRESADALVSNGVDVIIGPGISAAAVKVIDVAVCAGAIMFSPSTASPVFSDYPDHGLYFRAAASDVLRAPWLGGLVVADGNATVVLISRDDTWGNHLRQLTAQVIERAGVRVLDSFSYRPDTADHKGDVGRIKAKNPDAIVLIGLNDSAPILAEMIKEGLGPRDKRVYGASNLTNNLARLVDPQNPGVLAGMRGVNVDDGNDAFTSRMRAIDPGLQSFTLGAEAYDAVVVTALAAVSAGTDAPTTVAAHINEVTRGGVKCASYADCRRLILEGKDVDYDGASGPLDFTDAGEPSSVGYVIKEFQADGTVKALRAVKASLPG
jgi:branched-chain amino acid transport system substrate-binding protein